jgi:hypothetical protein
MGKISSQSLRIFFQHLYAYRYQSSLTIADCPLFFSLPLTLPSLPPPFAFSQKINPYKPRQPVFQTIQLQLHPLSHPPKKRHPHKPKHTQLTNSPYKILIPLFLRQPLRRRLHPRPAIHLIRARVPEHRVLSSLLFQFPLSLLLFL